MSLRTLEIARSAIMARQTEIELIGHNVANATTPGYARRRVSLASIPGEGSGTTLRSGRGVEVAAIQRMGDRLLEAQINVETGNLGHDSVMADAASNVESITAGADGRGLLDPVNALFDAFATVAGDPGAATPRQNLIAQAQSMCDAFRRTASSLRSALDANDQQTVAAVQQVNDLSTQVAELNVQIGKSGGATKALDLVEQRGLALNELSKLCGASGVAGDNGQVDVLLGGQHLVQGDRVTALQADLVNDTTPGLPKYHQITLGSETPPQGLGGELAGYTDARSQQIKKALTGLNDFAKSLADAINTQQQAGYDLHGNPGAALLTYDPNGPAASIQLNPAIAQDGTLIAAASAPGEPGNGDNAVALENLRSSSHLVQGHTDFLSGIGSDVRLANARKDARQAVTSALEARYQESSGVSIDEEALSLSEAQKAYTAAERVAQVALQMMDDTLKLV